MIKEDFKNAYGLSPLEKNNAKQIIKFEKMKMESLHVDKNAIDRILNGTAEKKLIFGYEGDKNKKRAPGEVWTDADGKIWEQKEWGKVKRSVMSDLRKEISMMKPRLCRNKDNCTYNSRKRHDRACNGMHGSCLNCFSELATELMIEGKWEEYIEPKITERVHKNFLGEVEILEDGLKGMDSMEANDIILETGDVEKWKVNKTIIVQTMNTHIDKLNEIAVAHGFDFAYDKYKDIVKKYKNGTINFDA